MAHVVDFVRVTSPENQVVHVWGIDFLVFTGNVHRCNSEQLQARPKNQHAHEEAIELGFWEGESADLVLGILGGDDEERGGKGVG